MKFIHYTSIAMAESILSSSISQGHLLRADQSMLHDVVWLTTSEKSYGHGLTNGKEKLSQSNLEFLQRVEQKELKSSITTADKTQVRFTLELKPNEEASLEKFTSYCKNNEPAHYAKLLGLSAVTNIKNLELEQLRKLMRSMNTKEATWWLSWRPIPVSKIVAVDFWTGNKYECYNFEMHGRHALEKEGIFAPSKEALQSLSNVIDSTHPLEATKALVICPNLQSREVVVVRGAMSQTYYSIEDGSQIGNFQTPENEGLRSWILENKQELLSCWKRAVSSYHAFHA
jgi:hypothetical protein